MPVCPKRRHSKSRSRKRRTHNAMTAVGASSCPRCNQAKLSHRVCGNCGHYRDKEVVAFEE